MLDIIVYQTFRTFTCFIYQDMLMLPYFGILNKYFLRFHKFSITHYLKVVFQKMGEADRFGPTQNSKLFIGKSVALQKYV